MAIEPPADTGKVVANSRRPFIAIRRNVPKRSIQHTLTFSGAKFDCRTAMKDAALQLSPNRINTSNKLLEQKSTNFSHHVFTSALDR